MRSGTILAFILGILIGSSATYLVMQAEVQRAVSAATESVGKKVRDMGTRVEEAGQKMGKKPGAPKETAPESGDPSND